MYLIYCKVNVLAYLFTYMCKYNYHSHKCLLLYHKYNFPVLNRNNSSRLKSD